MPHLVRQEWLREAAGGCSLADEHGRGWPRDDLSMPSRQPLALERAEDRLFGSDVMHHIGRTQRLEPEDSGLSTL